MTDNYLNNASRTNYPEIYKDTIWGQGSEANDTYTVEALPETISRRNDLVQRYNILRYKDHDLPGHRFRNEVNPFSGDYHHMKRFEFYELKNNKGYLAIFSDHIERPLHDDLHNMGYVSYDGELYDDRRTYFKTIPRYSYS